MAEPTGPTASPRPRRNISTATGSTRSNASSPTCPASPAARPCPPRSSRRQKRFFLPNSIFFQTITGDWADAAGEAGFTEPDMILRPDFSTATAAPWTADGTLQVIHDAFDLKGRPIAMRAPQRAASAWWTSTRAEGWHAGRRARDGILPRRPQHRPGQAHRADDGPHRPPRRRPSGLLDAARSTNTAP